MFLKIDNNTIEFSDDLLKISTYFEYFAKEYNEAIPVLSYDAEIFEIFRKWFKILQDEGVVKIENDIITSIFKPEFFENYEDNILNKMFNFAVINQIDLLVYTLAYVLRNSDNQMIKDINKNEKPIVDYIKEINEITLKNIYSNKSDDWFDDYKEIILIPYGINKINFTSSNNLKQLVIPNYDIEINVSFCNSKNLNLVRNNILYRVSTDITEFTFSNNITKIGDWAFSGCNKLKSLTIPDSVKDIGEYAFAESSIEKIELPNSITKIRNSTFSSTPIKSLKIPDSVVEIEDFAFYDSDLEQIEIPNSVKIIGSEVFKCSKIQNLKLPNKIKIGDNIVSYCSNLEKIKFPDDYIFGEEEFRGCVSLEKICVPSDLLFMYLMPKYKINFIGSIIGDFAFAGCYSIEKLIIPHYVHCICESAFEDCINLIEIVFDGGVHIESQAFKNCNSLSKIVFKGCCNIDEDAFENCRNVNDVIGFDNVDYYSIFEECRHLNVHYIKNPEEIYSDSEESEESEEFEDIEDFELTEDFEDFKDSENFEGYKVVEELPYFKVVVKQ